MKNDILKKLFLLDGIGALVSAFLLGVVLVKFQNYFGIPKTTLYVLAALPCFFAIYDFICFFKIDKNLGRLLKGIAIVNLLYCVLSLGLAFYHFQEITLLGWTYVIVEIFIVVILAIIEFKIAREYIHKSDQVKTA